MARTATARLSQSARSIEQARTLHQEGRLDEADRIYRRVLAADPRHPDALHLSGVLSHQRGRSVDALRLVGAALKAKPGSADVLLDYGMILDALKRHEEALASFDRALAMRDDAVLHFNRGNALKNLGRHADALASYDQALALAPDLTVGHYNRGNTLIELDRHEEALASYDQALALASKRAGSQAGPDAALVTSEHGGEALEILDDIVADNPHAIAALNNRGKALLRLKRYDEALATFDKILARYPDNADALGHRGVALAQLGQYDEALADYAQVRRIAPSFVHTLYNRGNAFLALARMEEALASYGEALALDPENPEANFNAAMTRLCLGDFREGWKQYEYRWERETNKADRPDYQRPMWRGEKDVQGKTILLAAEQGMGDAIQFARYAPLVAALGAKVVLGVHNPLTHVMTSVPGVSRVVGIGEVLPAFDLYCPLLSLPMVFETEVATIPARIPYIWPQQERIAKWHERLPQNGRLRVGVCWAGNSDHANDRHRSIPLERFAKVLSVSGVDFISLQKDVGAAQSSVLSGHGVTQLGQDFADFADTAAVIALLDLVIAVDTSVAHLAGAMGKAVGILVPFRPDFRWMLHRTDSPWYPTMRLFRQSAIGDWDGPLERLRAELTAVGNRPVKPR